MIGVKNSGEHAISARYDGKDYEFAPGVAVAISTEAASHIFGFGVQDKTRALQRLGWLRNLAQYDEALKRLDDIQFLAVENKFNEAPDMPRTALSSPTGDDTKMTTGEKKREPLPPAGESKIDIPQFSTKAAK